MNCDDRLEQLLWQAGQTISDISNKIELSDGENLIDYATASRGHAQAAVLHLTDIIDRLEWALDNTIRERDWLRRLCEQRFTSCDLCRYGDRQINVQPCASCTTFDTGDQYEFGLPEDVEAKEDREEDGDGLG